MNKIKFAVIACSKVANNRFIPALLKSNLGKLEFIASRDKDKAKMYAEKFGCTKYGNYNDAFSDPNIDAVYISTPIIHKKEWALKSALFNKHAIVEKPAFLNLDDSIEVLNIFKTKKLHFFENWMFKFHPQHNEFKKLLNGNNFGRIKYFSSQFTYPTPADGDIRLNPKLKGGVFYDSIGYPLAASLMIINEKPISVMCSMSKNKTYGVDDFVKIQLKFEKSVYADLLSGFGIHYKSTYSTFCERGILTANRAFAIDSRTRPTITINSDKGERIVELSKADQFMLMIDSFCNDIKSNKIGQNIEEILLQQKIIDVAYLSSFKKSVINI